MGPVIDYVTSGDGVRVAAWSLGSGPPLVHFPNLPTSDISSEWEFDANRRWLEKLAQKHRVIGWDSRGSGRSESEPVDVSPAAHLADMEAVVSWYGLERFAGFAVMRGTPLLALFASEHPAAVSSLVLWNAHADTDEYACLPRVRAVRTLRDLDWRAYLETIVFYNTPFADRKLAAESMAFYNRASSEEGIKRGFAALDGFNVKPNLPAIRCPVLVLQPEHSPWGSRELAEDVASRIPGAQLTMVPGDGGMPWSIDPEGIARVVISFLSGETVEDWPATTFGAASPRRHVRPSGLSIRELEVLKLIADGKNNKEIADDLVISLRTVEKHIANVYGKIEARGRADAVRFALVQSLV